MARLRSAVILACVMASTIVLVLPPAASGTGSVQVYMGGLTWPIALAFSPDARIFFAERLSGNIRIIQNGTLLPTPFYTLTGTDTAGERGLLGLALDPGFPRNPWVYAYQTFNDATNVSTYNRIVRIQANGNTGVSLSVILRLPQLSGATNHNGGVIAFGPDGKLYAVVGENANQALSQDPMSLLGKVLRMNSDGSAPTDNPFYGNASWNHLIYTYGHRNMFGLAFHPFTGRVYVTENGPACNDEVNLLIPGRNFGWGPTATCGTPPPPPSNTNRDGPNPVLPIGWWPSTICPTNAAIYGGPKFPAFRGDLFMGDCNYGRLHRLHLVPPNYDTVDLDSIVWTAPRLVLDVESGPDGAIWFTTDTTIYRFADSGQPPVASFTASPNPVAPATPVTFNASASRDPDGNITTYSWNFGDSSPLGSGVTTSHAYAVPGLYTTTLTVWDNESFNATATRQVSVTSGNLPPSITSATPSNASFRIVLGGTATLSVVASDPDGDALSYVWRVNGTLVNASGSSLAFHPTAIGTYTVRVTVSDGSLTDSHVWTVVVEAPPGPAVQTVPWWPFAVLALLVVAALLVVVWRRRRKGPAPP